MPFPYTLPFLLGGQGIRVSTARIYTPAAANVSVTAVRSLATASARPPTVSTNLPPLWNASPPVGVCPAPSGSVVGAGDSFDAGILAVNELWDNFDGTTLDSRLWLRDTLNQGGTQTYSNANSFLDGSSHAVLQATYNGASSPPVTSGRFTSRTKFNVQYGWHAARIKFPSFVGCFPALWMLFVGYNTQPGNYGEIDMMEFFSTATTYSTHLHFGGSITSIASDVDVPARHGEDAGNAYHTYWLYWQPDSIQIGVDDLYMGTWPPPNAAFWSHFNQPFYWILNFAVGPAGSFIPAPSAGSFPAQMLIDWVWSKPLNLL